MKKLFIFIITIALCLCFLVALNVFAAATYEITDRKVLNNFETGDPVYENYGGTTDWGAHWIPTTLSATDGLEGKVALKLEFGTTDVGTIGGVHADNIGTLNETDDWTPGSAMLFRIKNLSNKSVNLSSTIDVLDTNSPGRARLWPEGTQLLLDLNYNPVETKYAPALERDGVTTENRDLYVVIPAGFDGYVLCDLSKYVEDVPQPFESIIAESTVRSDWRSVVKHLVLLFQDCMGTSVVVDDFRLVDYKLVDIIEVVEEEAGPAEGETQAPVIVPQTSDGLLTVLAVFVISGVVVIKKRWAQ
ncbi:MAG: hypothetical protein FWF15_01655 [Oscillospiraceae bacterium]|nr:hypothetical protein [Oscillospiraceae bacterium]